MNRIANRMQRIEHSPVLRKGALPALALAFGIGAAFARGDTPQRDMSDTNNRQNSEMSSSNASNSDMWQSTLPNEITEDGVTYRVGGVGIEEAQAMKQAASDYPLMLSFADHMGGDHGYIADVEVTIRDQQGNTDFDTTAEGPLLLVDLPRGSYEIAANYQGSTLQRRIQVQPQDTERVYFEWNRPS